MTRGWGSRSLPPDLGRGRRRAWNRRQGIAARATSRGKQGSREKLEGKKRGGEEGREAGEGREGMHGRKGVVAMAGILPVPCHMPGPCHLLYGGWRRRRAYLCRRCPSANSNVLRLATAFDYHRLLVAWWRGTAVIDCL